MSFYQNKDGSTFASSEEIEGIKTIDEKLFNKLQEDDDKFWRERRQERQKKRVTLEDRVAALEDKLNRLYGAAGFQPDVPAKSGTTGDHEAPIFTTTGQLKP